MPASIRVIGSLNADMVSVTPRFPFPGETLTALSFTTSAGGKGANQAVACGRLSRPRPNSPDPSQDPVQLLTQDEDVHVEMIGAVGKLDSHFASLLQPTLQKSGVDTSNIREVEQVNTGVAVIVVDNSAGGENRILFSPGANYAGMQPTEPVLNLSLSAPVPDVMVLQAEIPIETVIEILRGVASFKRERRESGHRGIDSDIEVVFNPAPAPENGLPSDVFDAVEHFVMNETECELMAPKDLQEITEPAERRNRIAKFFHGLGVRYVLVTLGAKGVWYSAADPGTAQDQANSWIRYENQTPAGKVEKVVDTTAAGDTFVGGYSVQIARWRERRRAAGLAGQDLTEEERRVRYQNDILEAVQSGVRASARCVERQGAMDSIPWEDEI